MFVQLASGNSVGNTIREIARKTRESPVVISLLDSNLLAVSATRTWLEDEQKDARHLLISPVF